MIFKYHKKKVIFGKRYDVCIQYSIVEQHSNSILNSNSYTMLLIASVPEWLYLAGFYPG